MHKRYRDVLVTDLVVLQHDKYGTPPDGIFQLPIP